MPAKFTSPRFDSTFSRTPLTVAKRAGLVLAACATLIMVSACGSRSSTQSSVSTPLAPAPKLALGTLKLEGTDQAIDASLASQLLPLWQLMAELDSSSSAAPQETAAVVEQIQATMTADQIAAIEKLHLTQGDIAQAAVSGGASPAAGSTTAQGAAQAPSGAAAGSLMVADMVGGPMSTGGIPGGSMPGGSSQKSTTASKSSSSASAPSLIQQVIDLLESKLEA